MKQHDFSAPAGLCNRLQVHEERRQHRLARTQRLDDRRAASLVDEAAATESPETLVRIWESWDRRVTEQISRQQTHALPSSFASPTRSSVGRGQAPASTSKSRRKLFLSVLGVNEPVDLSEVPATADRQHVVALEEPVSQREVLVPYIPEHDETAAAVAPGTKYIEPDRLERLRQKRRQQSAAPKLPAAGRQTALEQLAEQLHTMHGHDENDFDDVRDDDDDDEGQEKTPAAHQEKETRVTKEKPKQTVLRSKQHISPREKKHLLTKVRSRQSGSAQRAAQPNRPGGSALVSAAHGRDSSNEADFASSSCDPSQRKRRVARGNQTRQQSGVESKPNDVETKAFEEDNAADADDCDDGEAEDPNEHVYASDIRCSRNVHWDHLHSADGKSHEDEVSAAEGDESDERGSHDGEDSPERSPAQVDAQSPTSADKILEQLLRDDEPTAASAVPPDESGTTPSVATVLFLCDEEEGRRIDIHHEERDERLTAASIFSLAVWELQVMVSECVEDELIDRLRVANTETGARTELFAEARDFLDSLAAVLRTVDEQEASTRRDVERFELECRYDFIVCPTLEASCDDRAREMIQQLDVEQNSIVEELEDMHREELASEKEHTRSLVDEYERLMALFEENAHGDKLELVRVLTEEKNLTMQGEQERHNRAIESIQMTHEDDLSDLRSQHANVLAERKSRVQSLTAAAMAKLRNEARDTSCAALMHSTFLAWRQFAAASTWNKVAQYERIERESHEGSVALAHRAVCDSFVLHSLEQEEVAARLRLELDATCGFANLSVSRCHETAPALNRLQVQLQPLSAERDLLTHDVGSHQARVQHLEELVRKMSHLLQAQKMLTTGLASKCDQQQTFERMRAEKITRLTEQRRGLAQQFSDAARQNLLQRAFIRWLLPASSQPLARLRKLRHEEAVLRRELKCWHDQSAVSAPRDPMGPLHPSLALAGHQFAEHLRVDKVSPKSSSVQPSLGRDPVSVDETVQALKHLLTKERQATAALHEDLDETRTALQESSDALQESLEHRASLQRLLRGVLDHCAAKGLSVPQHLTGRGMKPMQGDKSSQRSKQQASRVTAYDGAGASEPFEQP